MAHSPEVQNAINNLSTKLGVVSFNMVAKKTELDELRKQYDQLHAQLAVLQGLPEPTKDAAPKAATPRKPKTSE
jgi:uncharacterized coiled-coil DUF342 family protein